MPRLTVSQVTGQAYYRSPSADEVKARRRAANPTPAQQRWLEELRQHLLPVRR